MSQYCEILLDGVSILDRVRSLHLDRRADQAVDTLTLELADFSLYSEFDFSVLPVEPRIEVLTGTAIAPVSQGKFFVERPDVIESKDAISIPSLWGRSELARLIDPFAERITKTWTVATSLYGIILELVENAGMDPAAVAIDIDDFAVPANIYSVSGQYPLQIIIDLVSKTNGYARSTRAGDLWIQKQLFHLGGEPVALALDESNIAGEISESGEAPEFGNRILIRTQLSAAGQEYQIRLELDTGCIRGTSTAVDAARAIVTDGSGAPAGDGVPVLFTIDNPALGTFFPETALCGEWPVTGELQQAGGLLDVSTDYPIREVLGVYLETDFNKAVNYYTGGSFDASGITLGVELPFTDSRVVIDYIGAGVAQSTLYAVAGAPEAKTSVHAAIGKIRDSAEFCINNQLNVSISLHASKTEYNLCKKEQAMISALTAQVKMDGVPANGMMINWQRRGEAGGTVTPKWSALKNTQIDEIATSRNNYTVSVANDISSVVGVYLGTVVGGVNYYSRRQDRQYSFDGREITLGTNLPGARMAVIVRYVAFATATASYTNPLEIGDDEITATVPDGTSTPAEESVTIETLDDCTGATTGGGGGGGASGPGGRKDCTARCAPPILQASREDCICVQETGVSCPSTAEGCEDLCRAMVAKYGNNPLDCDVAPTSAETETLAHQLGILIPMGEESAYASCAESVRGDPEGIPACVEAYIQATIDRCKQKCLNHGVLNLSPPSAAMNCTSGVSFSVSGGVAPYSWSASKGTLTTSGAKNDSAILRAPANAGAAVAGIAYVKAGANLSGTYPACGATFGCYAYSCNDASLGTTGTGNCCNNLWGLGLTPGAPVCSFTITGCPGGDIIVTSTGAAGPVEDKRSAPMIAAGCNPCSISMAGTTTVTVTDSSGKSATAVITG